MDRHYRLLGALTFLLGLTLASAYSHSRTEEFISRLISLQETSQIAPYLGAEGRILETVNYDAGIWVRYFNGTRECAGKLKVMPTGLDEFQPDPRCSSPVSVQSSEERKLAMVAGPLAKSDVETLLLAVRFIQRLPSLRPQVQEVLGARREESRVVLSYRSKESQEICWIGLKPVANGRSWQVDIRPACQTQ